MACPHCKVLLAFDRLEQEFPTTKESFHMAEHALTISDVLRETSGAPISGPPVPLDDTLRRSRSKSAGSGDDLDPSSYSDTSATGRTSAPLDVILSFGALGVIMLLMVGLGIRGLMGDGVSPRLHHQTIAATAPVASLPATGQANRAAPQFQPLAATLPGGWTRLVETSSYTLTAQSPDWAIYGLNGSKVDVTAVAATDQTVGSLEQFSSVPRTVLRTGVSALQSSAHAVTKGNTSCYVYDAPTAGEIVTGNGAIPPLPHTVTWLKDGCFITVASANAAARDQVADALMSAK